VDHAQREGHVTGVTGDGTAAQDDNTGGPRAGQGERDSTASLKGLVDRRAPSQFGGRAWR